MKLFNEEQVVLAKLLEEWYAELKVVTDEANGIFSAKAQQYDKSSPVWERIKWPHGFVQELRKKTDRVSQLLETDKPFTEVVDDVNEELIDIMNYARMFAALNNMVADRDVTDPSRAANRKIAVQVDDLTRRTAAERERIYKEAA